MRTFRVIRLVALLCAVGTVVDSWAELPTLNYHRNGLSVLARASNNEWFLTESFTQSGTLVLPTNTTVEIINPELLLPPAVPKISHSKNVINWEIIGNQYVLSVDIDHQRDGRSSNASSPSAYTLGQLHFTVDRDTPFEMSAFYDVTDFADDSFDHVLLGVKLASNSSTLHPPDGIAYSHSQTSKMTHNEQFVLGVHGGDSPSPFVTTPTNPFGSTTGMLYKDQLYDLVFEFEIRKTGSLSVQKPGASALGNFTFKIGEATVPEPSTLVLLLPAAAVLMRRRR